MARKSPRTEWVTTAEAVELTGYSPHHIRRLARNGQIEGIKMGREWLIHLDSLRAYTAAMKRLSSVEHE
jgi:excisionase family DNA binding protein